MDQEAHLIADALVTYADTCTLPRLTPSCPFFRSGDEGPTCGEECRDVIARHGGEERPEASRAIGGLVLHGRSIPVRVAGGIEEFDATRSYLQDHQKQPREQSTPSLMLSLRAVLVEHAITGRGSRLDEAKDLWAELSRRIPAVNRAYIGGLSQSVANAVSTRVVLEHLRRGGNTELDEAFGIGEVEDGDSWLAAAEASRLTAEVHRSRSPSSLAPDLDLLRRALPQLFRSKDDIAALLTEPLVEHVLSPVFVNRVTRWLGNILPIDPPGALAVRPPTDVLFAALDASDNREEIGRWLWERFTVTTVDDWSYPSLVLEWDWIQKGFTDHCDTRAMAERTISEERLARLAMQRAANAQNAERPAVKAFEPARYVPHALRLLRSGDLAGASRVFEGLVELSPGHSTAWNNLGFCQLPDDANAALVSFRRAEALSRFPSMIALANETLALHLLSKDEEALEVASEALEASQPVDSGHAWVWQHPSSDPSKPLSLGDVSDVRQYLVELADHIRNNDCAHAAT